MFRINMLCYPWDLEDEGLTPALDRLQGELGVTGLTVVAAGDPVCQLRRRPDLSPRLFRTEGGFYFPPDGGAYERTRCKPVVAKWLGTRNPLAKVADACRTRRLEFRVVLDSRHVGATAARYPACAVKNVLGERSPSLICLNVADAAELLRAAARDLYAHYAPDVVEWRNLERVHETDPWMSTLTPDVLGDAGRALLAICFCESCLQSSAASGVDGESARRAAEQLMSSIVDRPPPLLPSPRESWERQPELARYVAFQKTRFQDVARSLLRATPGVAGWHLVVSPGSDSALPTPFEIAAPQALAEPTDRIILSPSPTEPLDRDSLWSTPLELAGRFGLSRSEIKVCAHEPTVVDPPSLVRSLKRLADGGIAGVCLDHYGLMGSTEWTAAKQAIRYARRSFSG